MNFNCLRQFVITVVGDDVDLRRCQRNVKTEGQRNAFGATL